MSEFFVSPARLKFESFPQRTGRYSGMLYLYLDAACTVEVSRGTWRQPITSVIQRPIRSDIIGSPVQVFVRNELGKVVGKISVKPVGSSTGAIRVAFSKDYGNKPLRFGLPGHETTIFEGILQPGEVVPFWLRFEVSANDLEQIDDFQIEVKAEFSDVAVR